MSEDLQIVLDAVQRRDPMSNPKAAAMIKSLNNQLIAQQDMGKVFKDEDGNLLVNTEYGQLPLQDLKGNDDDDDDLK